MQDRPNTEREQQAAKASRDPRGERGYRGRSPAHTPPGAAPGGSYGAGGGYQQGGHESAEAGSDEWRRGYGNYGVTGQGPSPQRGWAGGPEPRQREAREWTEYDYGLRGQHRQTGPDARTAHDERDHGTTGSRGREAYGSGTPQWSVPGPHAGKGPRGYGRPEAAIRDEVCERLTWHGGVDASDISVRVERDEVLLDGEVDSRAAKRLVEDVAESVTGVFDVHNRLRIRR